MTSGASTIAIDGARYPEPLEKRTGLKHRNLSRPSVPLSKRMEAV